MSATIRKATLAYVRVASLSTRLLHALPQWQKKTDTPQRVPVGRKSASDLHEILSEFHGHVRDCQNSLRVSEKTAKVNFEQNP